MKSLTDGRSTRWQQHRDLRRRELLRAVRHVVDEHGDELSMEQISEHSGTTKSVLYRYFTDRAGLQSAMGEWAMDVIAKSLDDATAASAQDALTEMIRAFVALAAESPNIYRFCDTAVNRFAPTETGGFFNSIAGLLAERLGIEGPQGQLWAAGAIGFVRAATENWLANPGRPDEFATAVSHWLWASLPAKLGVDE
ncbi:MAG: TetR/AcrR family transcriptional regulator [Brevibacterium sp.]|uniref:TetR/AcrR family transcriptional regulator n=1 Tax=Brevibacterium sp. TaxID=1701 RepID=UPI002648AD5B|nr:TetR/AcrR family transcriptional regulator [Brevibacterium sp.]MDN5805615.1 TetR/AcrR family transcriptional regulator [Brevibacterium sp.]MDN5832336.1 TetR/AcrR family transcriptional regulator [Brevibacterium sp.]MDN5876649.1 TetR/AcrR family transcriptional regulator [Brevibacterium sp.]MDN5908983.1 TetR/AcrR family transcriptional regulator [Brevibacterium sp.]MDN6134875.1 TetR/AcrR family transcriptional regulator [Brevibacterium sp.]